MSVWNDPTVLVTGIAFAGIAVGSHVYRDRWPWLALAVSTVAAVCFVAAIWRARRAERDAQ